MSLGQTIKLSCSRSGGSWYAFSWYQQKPGQNPRLLLYGGSTRGEGVPDRITGSYSGVNGDLTITNVQPEDEARYYCAAWYDTGSTFHGDAD